MPIQKNGGKGAGLSCPKCGSAIPRASEAFEKEGEKYCCVGCAEDKGCSCANQAVDVRARRRPKAR